MTLASLVSVLPGRFTELVAPGFLSAAEDGDAKKTQMVLDASARLKPKRDAASSLDKACKP